MNIIGKYIRFSFLTDTGKTKVWEVFPSSPAGDIVLSVSRVGSIGSVKWFGRWRKYAFFPENDCVFEEVCLREIAQFCVDATKEHRTLRKKAA